MGKEKAQGMVQTDDVAQVLFTFQGRTLPLADGGADQLLAVMFATEDERFRWLNECFCVLEGAIDLVDLHMRARLYTCANELI